MIYCIQSWSVHNVVQSILANFGLNNKLREDRNHGPARIEPN